jgi:D-lactate dehydrogenase (cytochrome)
MNVRNKMTRTIYGSKSKGEFPDTPLLESISSQEEIQERYIAYLTDESRLSGGRIEELVFAHSEKQVVETLQKAHHSRTQVTVSAARTGIVGGAVPAGGTLLSLEKMDRFLGARWDDELDCWCVRVEPGVSLDQLTEILDKKDFDNALILLKGKSKDELQRFAKESDRWFYPVDPTEKSAHLGGTVATNASGARSFKYGQTRDHVISLRTVLADGTVLSIRRGAVVDVDHKGFEVCHNGTVMMIPPVSYKMPAVKNTAGYFNRQSMDFIDYFIGSEGTLGVITEIEFALRRKSEFKLGVVAFFPSEKDAVRFVTRSRDRQKAGKHPIDPSALEYFDSFSLEYLRIKRDQDGFRSAIPLFSDSSCAAVYFEQEGNEEDFDDVVGAYDELLPECHTNLDETWAATDKKEFVRMAVFRHTIPEIINTIIGQRRKDHPDIHKVGTDFVVPDEHLSEIMGIYKSLLDSEEIDYIIFGHIGENHLHVNLIPKNQKELNRAKELYMSLAQKVVSLGGTVSGEHGIGKLKKMLLDVLYDSAAIEQMKKIKQAFDPFGLLGTGNLFQ